MKLDRRLSAVASLVRPGSVLADVGTDHAYLPVYLVETGVCPGAIASDLRTGPLKNAEATVAQHGLQVSICTRLSDGLDAFGPGDFDDVVLAGMGGLLIAEILSRAPWLKDGGKRIIAQPMRHPQDVRRWFYENGFEILREVCVTDGAHCYCAMAAEPAEKAVPLTPAMPYVGALTACEDADAARFLSRQRKQLETRRDALCKADPDSEEANELTLILADFDRLTKETIPHDGTEHS